MTFLEGPIMAFIAKHLPWVVKVGKIGGPFLKKWYQQNRTAQMYADYIRNLCSDISVFPGTHPVPLEQIFTEFDVLSDPLRQGGNVIIEERFLGKGTSDSLAQRQPCMEVVRLNNRVLLFGKPGAGKSTFLKYLALRSLDERVTFDKRVPIFISLGRFVREIQRNPKMTLIDFAASPINFTKYLKKVIENGQALVLCDGLDEIQAEKEILTNVISQLEEFINTYHQCHILVTCRVADIHYIPEAGFTFTKIADFTREQMHSFVRKWFGTEQKNIVHITNRAATTLEEHIANFFLILHEHPRIYELARVPQILALLCYLFEENQNLPPRRSEIFETLIARLIEKGDKSHPSEQETVYGRLVPIQRERLLAKIAAESMEIPRYIFEQRELERQIVDALQTLFPEQCSPTLDGNAELRAIETQHGLFVEHTRGLYSFFHLSVQEYFTARYLAEDFSQTHVVPEVTRLADTLSHHFMDPSWREVFLLTAEMLKKPDMFFTFFHECLDTLIAEDTRVQELFGRIERETSALEFASIPSYILRVALLQLILTTSSARDTLFERNTTSSTLIVEKTVTLNEQEQAQYDAALKIVQRDTRAALDWNLIGARISAARLTGEFESQADRKTVLRSARRFYDRAVTLARRYEKTRSA